MSSISEIKEFNISRQQEIGRRIQDLRIEHGLTGAEIGAYLNVTSNQISRIETGKVKCKLEYLYILAQVFDCSADYLLFGKEIESKYTQEQMNHIDALIASFR